MPKTAVVFPGQGSQYQGMGKFLYNRSQVARETFQEAGDILHLDMAKLCFEGSLQELSRTENAQPAILTASVAAYRVYRQEFAEEPVYMAGHSLGEFTALACAEACSFPDALKLVRNRGWYMREASEAGSGSMKVISGIEASIVERECSRISGRMNQVSVSNYNHRYQTVISGHTQAVMEAAELLERMGARATGLNVSGPFHSELMRPAAGQLAADLQAFNFRESLYPVLSNVTGTPCITGQHIPDLLTAQMVRPVQWSRSMEFLCRAQVDTVIELGPGNVLTNLTRHSTFPMKAFAFDNQEDIGRLQEYLDPGTPAYPLAGMSLLERCAAAVASTPNLAGDAGGDFTRQSGRWRDMLHNLYALKAEQREPDTEHMEQAIELLQSSFDFKHMPPYEQKDFFADLLEQTGTVALLGEYVSSLMENTLK